MPDYEPWDNYTPQEEPGFLEKIIIAILALISDIFWRK